MRYSGLLRIALCQPNIFPLRLIVLVISFFPPIDLKFFWNTFTLNNSVSIVKSFLRFFFFEKKGCNSFFNVIVINFKISELEGEKDG